MLTSFHCEICGASGVEHAHEYDGLLGYEAIICRRCGWSCDHNGYQPPDAAHLADLGIKPTWAGPAPVITDTAWKRIVLDIQSIITAAGAEPAEADKKRLAALGRRMTAYVAATGKLKGDK